MQWWGIGFTCDKNLKRHLLAENEKLSPISTTEFQQQNYLFCVCKKSKFVVNYERIQRERVINTKVYCWQINRTKEAFCRKCIAKVNRKDVTL